jgi:hypothetical protein
MSKHKLSDDSTIYHYTLLRRFTRKHPFYWMYSAFLLLWLFADTAYLGVQGIILLIGSAVTVIAAHAIIAFLLLRFSKGTVPRLWNWVAAYPFYGYLPAGFVPIGQWNRANRHRLLIGFSLLAVFYVWLPLPWLANAAAAHYFLLLPQLIYVGSCMRVNRGGLMKATPQEISFYKN